MITYLLCYAIENEDGRSARYEISSAWQFRKYEAISVREKRGDHTIVAFCDQMHGHDFLNQHELKQVINSHFEGDYRTTSFNLRD